MILYGRKLTMRVNGRHTHMLTQPLSMTVQNTRTKKLVACCYRWIKRKSFREVECPTPPRTLVIEVELITISLEHVHIPIMQQFLRRKAISCRPNFDINIAVFNQSNIQIADNTNNYTCIQ